MRARCFHCGTNKPIEGSAYCQPCLDLFRGCAHKIDDPPLGYLEWHDDADKRAKRGEKQRMCSNCKRYVWEEFYTGAIQDRPATSQRTGGEGEGVGTE